MDEFNFSKLTLISGGNWGRTELSLETSENADDSGDLLLRMEIEETTHPGKSNSVSIEYLDEKQIIELFHYLKSCLLTKYPNI